MNKQTRGKGILILMLSFTIWLLWLGLYGEEKQAPTEKAKETRRQILVNPDFSLPADAGGNPPGWFKAMIPSKTTDLKAGLQKDDKGVFLYLEQAGVNGNLFNNWAQRIENPPIGVTMELETEVSTEKAGEKGAVVLVMFFDEGGKILGAASSEDKFDLSGTKPWTKINISEVVPDKCNLAIVRLGLSANPGKLMVRYARLYVSGEAKKVSKTPVSMESREWTAGLELLQNGNFEGNIINDTPVGWFRAMMSDQAIDHKAGVETIPDRGKVVYIEQKGVKISLVNNWAQRLEVIPIGATLRLSADVKTENVPENTGFVMIQCWDTKAGSEGKLLAAATTQSSQPIGGTEDWKTVTIEVNVPEKTDAIIVRCGFSQSGKIWFDNASLKIVTPPAKKKVDSDIGIPDRGFEVTEASMKQLEKVNTLGDKLLKVATEELGAAVEVRKEVFALGNGQYEVVIKFLM